MKRNRVAGLLLLMSCFTFAADSKQGEVTIFKNANCGCCSKWAEHLMKNGFQSKQVEVEDVADYKIKFGVPDNLQSCHTSVVDGYFIEGHVPAEDVARLLKEQPNIKGLAVPGMPMGSPGMEMGDRKDTYDVLAIKNDGSFYVYNTHNAEK